VPTSDGDGNTNRTASKTLFQAEENLPNIEILNKVIIFYEEYY
jgi:hypothetical protein